ncbi:hypothetical protein [Ruficoccus sp. ZRK36]|uniref:hypothetical protein n=1 Tax=Ruficoccus sp. ZRK36 TaxID=2866311 RepID=UPI001C72CED9|nr:hypothetical protein [Ruficoccus sp. ZRK36]QYY36751.1 hypothetical protein K0V07_04565 [Ruficoccus sp. ZRK36]
MIQLRKHTIAIVVTCVGLASSLFAAEPTVEELQEQIRQLQVQLQQAQAQLQEKQIAADAGNYAPLDEAPLLQDETGNPEQVADSMEDAPEKVFYLFDPEDFKIGPVTVGGAIRANYIYGDYPSDGSGGPSRGSNGGNFELDTFRLNFDLDYEDWLIGKMEYRWYDGYSFMHTLWLGYRFEDGMEIQAGINRVPFGPGPYGISNSWFFDQHYYVGLSDDMDTGIKVTTDVGNWTLDGAIYFCGEGSWLGPNGPNNAYADSARYSYDPVKAAYGRGYQQDGQLNFRGIYHTEYFGLKADLGTSLQVGHLNGTGGYDDGSMYAVSGFAVHRLGDWTLQMQLSYYNYSIDKNGMGDNELIPMGAYSYEEGVATEGLIPAISLSYFYEVDQLDWLDSVTPYIEYSNIIKYGHDDATGQAFKNSALSTVGAAWAAGRWYIYTETAFSNGNYFVGGDPYTNFGANLNETWEYRININFGYYF